MQHSSHLLMIKPVRFDFNVETAVNNRFQVRSADTAVADKAASEFDAFVAILTAAGVDVTVVTDTPEPHTPDAVFPNNWVSFHSDGTLYLYPMFAANRRLERKPHVLAAIGEKFEVKQTIDLSGYEQKNIFLEGTGSMVLDREHRIAYACLSPRTARSVLEDWCTRAGYRAVSFTAADQQGAPIYHTNVMMCVADAFAVVCTDSITDTTEREALTGSLAASGKEIISISFNQMNRFAGNMLQVHNRNGKKFMVMSTQAYQSLNPEQLRRIEAYNRILHSDITTIETNGGGSARCMMAEVFLQVKQ